MRIYNLSKKSREEFLEKSNLNGSSLPLKDLKIAELEDTSLAIIYDKEIKLYFGRRDNETYFPLLKDEQILPKLPFASVDMGAIKYVCNGANVMRPGIVSFSGDFKKDDLVVVKESSHSKAIAIGKALVDGQDAVSMQKGPVIQNFHYVGDKLWEALKSVDS